MGDRARVTIKDGNEYTPSIYVHWAGTEMPDYIKEAGKVMRKGDSSYALARLCGFLHGKTGGDEAITGLGILAAPTESDVEEKFENYSHGDAGVFVIDINSGEVECFAGYHDDKKFTIELGA